MTRGSEPTVTRRPSGRTSSARNPPSSLSCTSAVTVKRPGLEVGALEDLDLDGAHEGVALDPGVLAGGVGELAGERVDEVGEAARRRPARA